MYTHPTVKVRRSNGEIATISRFAYRHYIDDMVCNHEQDRRMDLPKLWKLIPRGFRREYMTDLLKRRSLWF